MIHPNARPMNGLFTRLASALAVPWQTSYTAPAARTLDALVHVAKGYDVFWTPVGFDEKDDSREPASVCYRIFKVIKGERITSHAVEVDHTLPTWIYRAEHKLRENLRALLFFGFVR
jgi:hypothetical protein